MHLSFLIFSLLLFALPDTSLASNEGGISIRYGRNNQICRKATELAGSVAKFDYWADQWSRAFGSIPWEPLGMSHASYVITDIDNDGKPDLIVNFQGTTRSVIFDLLFLLRPEQLTVAKQIDSFEKLEASGAQLSPRNGVEFTDGTTAVPVSTHIWNHDQKRYLIMKEHFFAKSDQIEEGRYLPNSLFVGVLDGPRATQFDPLYKVRRLLPKKICRIVWK